MNLVQNSGHPRAEGNYLAELGRLYARSGKSGLALEEFQQAVRRFEETGDTGGVATVQHSIANLYRARGELATAIALSKASLTCGAVSTIAAARRTR